MSIFESDDKLQILRLEQLDEPPRDPSLDEIWWEADVMNDDEGPYTINVKVTQTGAATVEQDLDDWAREELQRVGNMHDPAELLAMSPITIRP